jgi:hypothetical protein
MRRSLLCAAVVLAAVVLAQSSSAAMRFPIATDATSPAVTDGWKRIAYMPTPGRLQLLVNRSQPVYALDVSAGCSVPPRLIAIGGGNVLFACDSSGDISLLDIASRTLHDVPGARAALQAADARTLGSGAFTDVGAYGLRFESTAYHEGTSIATLDWRTGGLSPAPETETTTQNLYDPSFVTRLCAPLKRARRTGLLAEGPYDPVWPGVLNAVFERRGVGLTIEECDSGKTHVLWSVRKHATPIADVQRAAYMVTWVVPRTPDRISLGVRLHAYLPNCGVDLDWKLAPYARTAIVRSGLFVSEAQQPDGPWDIRRIPTRDICTKTGQAWGMALDDGRRLAGISPQSATLRLPGAGTVARLQVQDGVWPTGATMRPSGPLRIEPGTLPHLVRSVRARIGDGAWKEAIRRPLSWALPLPSVSKPYTLALEVRYRDGGRARYRVRIAPPHARRTTAPR